MYDLYSALLCSHWLSNRSSFLMVSCILRYYYPRSARWRSYESIFSGHGLNAEFRTVTDFQKIRVCSNVRSMALVACICSRMICFPVRDGCSLKHLANGISSLRSFRVIIRGSVTRPSSRSARVFCKTGPYFDSPMRRPIVETQSLC